MSQDNRINNSNSLNGLDKLQSEARGLSYKQFKLLSKEQRIEWIKLQEQRIDWSKLQVKKPGTTSWPFELPDLNPAILKLRADLYKQGSLSFNHHLKELQKLPADIQIEYYSHEVNAITEAALIYEVTGIFYLTCYEGESHTESRGVVDSWKKLKELFLFRIAQLKDKGAVSNKNSDGLSAVINKVEPGSIKAKWKGELKEFAELIDQLQEKGWIEIDDGDLKASVSSFCKAFDFSATKRKEDSNTENSLNQYLKVSERETKIYTQRYKKKFNSIETKSNQN